MDFTLQSSNEVKIQFFTTSSRSLRIKMHYSLDAGKLQHEQKVQDKKVQQSKSCTTRKIKKEVKTYFSFWPVVLLKNIIIHFSRSVSDEHDGLAAHAAMSRLIKLQTGKKQHMKYFMLFFTL